jgi:hypothetical protein
MRFRLGFLLTLLLSLSGTAAVHAQLTKDGVLEIWLKAREAVDAASEQKVTLYQKSKALVIGMDHYESWPRLSTGIMDAEEIAKALAAQGFEVTLRKDLKSDELDRTLKRFFIRDGEDANARLLLWFAGHGDTIDGEGYIVPIDAPSAKADADFRDRAISLRRFGEYMREAKSRHVLAIFDSCFSGSVFNVARSAPPPAVTLATTQPVREFISSGEANQEVSDNGLFRKLFLDALAGKEPDADANHDGYVTGTELGLFLQQKMTNLTNNRQTPRYGKLNAYGYDRGDFVFQVGKADVPATSTAPIAQSPNEAERAWAAVKDTNRSADLEAFLRRYGDSFYGDLARTRLEELKKGQVAVAALPQSASSPSVNKSPANFPENRQPKMVTVQPDDTPAQATTASSRGDSNIGFLTTRSGEQALLGFGAKPVIVCVAPKPLADDPDLRLFVNERGENLKLDLKVMTNVQDAFDAFFKHQCVAVAGGLTFLHRTFDGDRTHKGIIVIPPPPAPQQISLPSVVTAPAGGFVVQISSQKSEDDAHSSFRALQSKYADQLSGRQPMIVRKDLGSKGIYFSVGVGPFASGEDARTLCESLKAAGGDCVIQKN